MFYTGFQSFLHRIKSQLPILSHLSDSPFISYLFLTLFTFTKMTDTWLMHGGQHCMIAVKWLPVTRTSHMSAFTSQLLLFPSDFLPPLWEVRGWPCYPCGLPEWSSWLQSLAWPFSAGCCTHPGEGRGDETMDFRSISLPQMIRKVKGGIGWSQKPGTSSGAPK